MVGVFNTLHAFAEYGHEIKFCKNHSHALTVYFCSPSSICKKEPIPLLHLVFSYVKTGTKNSWIHPQKLDLEQI